MTLPVSNIDGAPRSRASPIADPEARTAWHTERERSIWFGWLAAAVLHGGLLTALIIGWQSRKPPPPPSSSAVSLLMTPAPGPAARASPAPPRPEAVPAEMPPATPIKIAERQKASRSKPAALQKAVLPPNRDTPTPSAPRLVIKAAPSIPLVNGGFVAATPVTGDVNQPPAYPQAAQLHGEQGEVLLSIHVLPSGQADSVSVTQSSGYGILDRAAASAVWKWRFQPSTLAGHAVPSVIPYRIRFNLRNASSHD